MKRDMDLVRNILLRLEAQDSFYGFQDVSVDGHSEDQLSYHVLLLHEAGLIKAIDMSTMARASWKPVRLTWSGHEFLDASRDESRWSNAKDTLAKAGGGLVFEVLKQILVEHMKKAVGLG